MLKDLKVFLIIVLVSLVGLIVALTDPRVSLGSGPEVMGLTRQADYNQGWSDRDDLDQSAQVYSAKFIKLVNAERLKRGLLLFLADAKLYQAAAEASRMTPEPGKIFDLKEVLERQGVQGRIVEPITMVGNTSPEKLLEIFLTSPENLKQLNWPDFAGIGVGASRQANGNVSLVVLLATNKVDTGSFRKRVFDLVNVERRVLAIPPVEWHDKAAEASQLRASEIEAVFAHERPSGQSWATALAALNIKYSAAGENISQGYRSPEEFIKAFMDSPPHRANMLDAKYNRLGIGGVVGTNGRFNCVQLFLRQ
ncbi:MAG: CAP domain-containing protein [Deltaproteobacteria bacterium]|jgi:uncharacterized protein YkwD|nr:CAP domain-containing protein [Deltaproteobacteria bacterium]